MRECGTFEVRGGENMGRVRWGGGMWDRGGVKCMGHVWGIV